MTLFDVVADNLFSLLSYKTKYLYADALGILYRAFKEQLKIKKSTLASMFISNLEAKMVESDFDGELGEEDYSLSGRAHFLIRKLVETGWIALEPGADFEEYIILPDYSVRLLETFEELTNEKPASGFSYVYETYATLLRADAEGGPYEKLVAVDSAYDKTQALIKILKMVYHNINRFCQKQMKLTDANDVLKAHYDQFNERIIEQYIRPLKVRDSVPKYRVPITSVIDKWLASPGLLEELAAQAAVEQSGASTARLKGELERKLFFVKDTYETLERDYLDKIDLKVRKYTRATTQKLDYILSSDRDLRGNLVYLVRHLIRHPKDMETQENVLRSFSLFRQEYVSEKSLFVRKRAKERARDNPFLMDDIDLKPQARTAFDQILRSRYSKKQVETFVRELFGESDFAYSSDIALQNDKAYILSLLAVLYSTDRGSFYCAVLLDGICEQNGYCIPNIRFERKARE